MKSKHSFMTEGVLQPRSQSHIPTTVVPPTSTHQQQLQVVTPYYSMGKDGCAQLVWFEKVGGLVWITESG